MATTIPPAPAIRALTSAGIASVSGALFVLAYLTVALRAQVDPITEPVSDDVFQPPGDFLFVVAILLALVGAALIGRAVSSTRPALARSTTVLGELWAGGSVLVAAFQGNRNAQDPTWHGELHRLGGAVSLTCLPLACWTLARALANARYLRRFAVAGLVVTALFGLAQVVPALPEGLLERVALGIDFGLLLTIALAVRRASS